MGARDTILDAVRRNRPAGEHPLPDLPHFPLLGLSRETVAERSAFFVTALKSMGGRFFDGPVKQLIAAQFGEINVIASVVPEVAGNHDLAATTDPRELADVDVAVVRAAFAIAETGTVALPDALLGVNAVAYLAQHIIVLVDPADIVLTVQDAYRRPDMAAHAYLAFHTGPSATADIEGVLIHGAQGVRSLTVVFAAKPASRRGAAQTVPPEPIP